MSDLSTTYLGLHLKSSGVAAFTTAIATHVDYRESPGIDRIKSKPGTNLNDLISPEFPSSR